MKKRWMMWGIVLLLFTACTQESSTKKEDFTYILFATPLEEHAIWQRVKSGFVKACEEEGFYCDWIGPKTIDTETMNDAVKTGILQGADAIITQGVVDEALLASAWENHIPVILVDSDMPQSSRNVYFGKDFHQQAEVLLEDIERHWGTDKHLVITIQVAEASFDIAKEQLEQIKEVFSNHPGGYEIVDVTSSKSDLVRAKKEWVASFTKHPDVNVALNFASESVESCFEKAKNIGINEQMLIYGVDDLSPTLELLKNGDINGSIVTPFYEYGYETVKFIARNLDNLNELNEIHPIHIQLVTPDNVKEYINENDS